MGDRLYLSYTWGSCFLVCYVCTLAYSIDFVIVSGSTYNIKRCQQKGGCHLRLYTGVDPCVIVAKDTFRNNSVALQNLRSEQPAPWKNQGISREIVSLRIVCLCRILLNGISWNKNQLQIILFSKFRHPHATRPTWLTHWCIDVLWPCSNDVLGVYLELLCMSVQ